MPLLGITVVTIALLLLSISRVIYPFDFGNYESTIWQPALYAIEGHNPYGYTLEPPYSVAPYGYFYYLIIGVGLKLFGWQFWFGRIFALVAAGVCVACVGAIVYWTTNKKLPAYAAVLALLSTFPFQTWLGLQRSDFPALALAFSALTITLYEIRSKDNSLKRAPLIVLLLALALFTKQTTILPVAFVIALNLQSGRIKQALLIFFGVGVIGAIVTFCLNFTSDGGYYFQHFYITRNISYSYQYSWSILREVLISPPSYIIFPLLFLGVYQIFKRLLLIKGAKQHERNFTPIFSEAVKSPVILLIGYFILSFALSFFTVARSGASINYYLEFMLVTAIVFGIALSSFESVMIKRKLYLALTGALVLFSFVRIISLYRGEYYRWESLVYYSEISETLEKSTPANGVVISVYPDLPALANRDFHFSDWMQYSDGRSPELAQILNEALKSNRYAAVIWQDLYVENLSPHCKYVPMKNPVPAKFYVVYLYVCDAGQTKP